MSASQRQQGKQGNLRCGNCSIWVSPVWRFQKTLNVLLCNACSCCYASKGVHRVKPSQEQLEKIAEAFEAKQTRNQAALHSASGVSSEESSQNSRLIFGKRKRQPRTWGADVITYQEEGQTESQPLGDRGKVERAEFDMYHRWSQSHTSSRESSDEELSPRIAAEILTSLKYAKVEIPKQAIKEAPVAFKRVEPTSNGFSAGIDGMVYLSVTPSKPITLKLKKPLKPERSCSRCGTTETPTWRKAGGNLDLCNACGVRQSSKLRSRQHPPLPTKPSVSRPLLQAHSLPVAPTAQKLPEPLPLPKATSMPTAMERQESQTVFDQFLSLSRTRTLPPVQQAPCLKPTKDLDYVAAARFSPFHSFTAPRVIPTETYRPPQRSLFQMVQPKLTNLMESHQNEQKGMLSSQSSNASVLPFQENMTQRTAYMFSQESLYE